MANHKSSKKRIRQTVAKRAHNRLYHKTARNAVKALRNTTEKSAAEALLPQEQGRKPQELACTARKRPLTGDSRNKKGFGQSEAFFISSVSSAAISANRDV